VYINKLLEIYEPSTVRLFHKLFKVAINAAVDNEIIPRNRFNKITIPVEEVNDNFLTAKELNFFLKAIVVNQLKIYRTWCKETKLSFGKHLSDDDFVFISYQ
jgi:hypothetical protein